MVQYFDTIPPANGICILKNGYLFAASEFGNHGYYQFKGIGDEKEKGTTLSTQSLEETVVYTPRGLRNLLMTDEIQSCSSINQMIVRDLTNEGSPQIYSLCELILNN